MRFWQNKFELSFFQQAIENHVVWYWNTGLHQNKVFEGFKAFLPSQSRTRKEISLQSKPKQNVTFICSNFKGTKWDVILTYFDDCKKLVYIQIDDDDRQNNLNKMMSVLNDGRTFKELEKTEKIAKNDVFCKKFENDHYWYRVKILNFENDDKVRRLVFECVLIILLSPDYL